MQLNGKISKRLILVLGAAFLAAAPATLQAQTSSINAFSPYSFYGIGDIMTQGTAQMRSMGGAGLGYRSPVEMNYLNPASYGEIGQRSALFSISGEGQNYYLRSSATSSSFNSFNIRDIGLSLPLAKNLGFGFLVSPYSDVGYRLSVLDDNPVSISDIGQVRYLYEGEGGITRFKAGVGWKITDRILVGADLAYYHGNIIRHYTQVIMRVTGTGAYSEAKGSKNEMVNSFQGIFGLQADIVKNEKNRLTLGATYQMGGDVNGSLTEYVLFSPTYSSGVAWQDYLRFSEGDPEFRLPQVYSAGLNFARDKWSVAADYSYSFWGGDIKSDITNDAAFRNTHTLRAGVQFTPNAGDIRYFMRRITYRAGIRYGNHYMNIKGMPINETAFTFGVGVPLSRTGLNRIEIGLEYAMRGTTANNLIKENIFKFTIGFTLFGEDDWFVKYKYD